MSFYLQSTACQLKSKRLTASNILHMINQKNQEKEKLLVRVFREELGLTRYDVRQATGIAERTLADIESGKSIPNTDKKVLDINQKLPQLVEQSVSGLKTDISSLKDNNQQLTKAITSLNQKNVELQSEVNILKRKEAGQKFSGILKDIITRKELDTKLKKVEEKAKEETLQERLRRERQEQIDAKYQTQEELRRERQEQIDAKYQTQEQLRRERQEQILKKQIEQGFYDQSGQQIKQEVNREVEKQASRNDQNVNQKILEVEQKLNNKFAEVEIVNSQETKQINNKLDNLNNKIPELITPTNVAIAVGLSEVIRQISQRTNAPSTCQAPVLIPPVAATTTATNTTLLGFQTASLAQGTAIQTAVNITKQAIINGKYGLQAIQKAADLAWKATHADKALQMLNTVLLVNNALYLGRNVGETIGDTASLVLASLNIKNSVTGEAIDVNEVIGTSIKSWIVNRIGQANFNSVEQTFAKSNRFYQGITNLYGSVRSLLASAEDIAEETNLNVAKIGNALRDSGTVENDSYNHMSDSIIPGAKLFSQLETVDDKADSFLNIISDIKDFQEEATEFNQDRKEFVDSLTKEKQIVDKLEVIEQEKIENLPNITEVDKEESLNDE